MATTTIVQLPLYTDPIYRYGATIGEESKQFTFYWNARCAQWHMDIRNEDQTDVALGVALVAQYPMLTDYSLGMYGIDGYFMLLPANESQVKSLNTSMLSMPQDFELFYIYTSE